MCLYRIYLGKITASYICRIRMLRILSAHTPNSAFYPISNWGLQSEFLYLGYVCLFTSHISLMGRDTYLGYV